MFIFANDIYFAIHFLINKKGRPTGSRVGRLNTYAHEKHPTIDKNKKKSQSL